MNKKVSLLVMVVLFALAGSAVAIGPLGPPTAGLRQSQFGVSVEYAHGQSDLEWNADGDSRTLPDVEFDTLLAQASYGLTDFWELYALVGIANVESDELEGGYNPSHGFGTKVTFLEDDELSWGALFEMGWVQGEDPDVDLHDLGLTNIDVDIDYYDIIVALGPTWKMTDRLRLYGGPLFYMLRGELDGPDGLILHLEEKSSFGGYIGADYDLSEKTRVYGELRFTGDMFVLGLGVGWRF